MSDTDQSQRTEDATPRRKEKLQREGKFARSADITAAAVVALVATGLALLGGGIARDAQSVATRSFRMADRGEPLRAVTDAFGIFAWAILPAVFLATVAAVGAGLAQSGLRFDLTQLAPKPERFDVAANLKRVLPTKESLGEIAKQLLKVSAVGVVVWREVASTLPELMSLPLAAPLRSAVIVGRASARVALTGVVAFAAVAALDFFLARRKFAEQSKMTRKEVLDEHKEAEGDPMMKSRRRAKARELAQQRAVADVREATVLVVNPTHIACAVRYVPEKDDAPLLLAKGTDETALRMRAEARAAGVPVIEHRPFARGLLRAGKIGRPIPVELFGLAAEVIAQVMQLGPRGAR